mgnify:CR=1 FL=1
MFIDHGYEQCPKEPCVYRKYSDRGVAIFAIWVDDNFITGDDAEEIARMIETLGKIFDIKILGRLTFALGIRFEWRNDGVHMSQTAYAERVASRFHLDEARPTSVPMQKGFRPSSFNEEESTNEEIPYREAIGSLLYLALCTRPDISYAVCTMARYSNNHSCEHWTVVKNIIRYVQMTKGKGVLFSKENRSDDSINGYADSSYNDSDTGRSTNGYIIFLHGNPVLWRSQLTKSPAQSTMEAEIIAIHHVLQEIKWITYVLSFLEKMEKRKVRILCDNNAAIQSVKDHRVTDRNKHIRPKYFGIVDQVKKGVISIDKVSSEEQLADIFTKAIANPQFSNLRDLIKVR